MRYIVFVHLHLEHKDHHCRSILIFAMFFSKVIVIPPSKYTFNLINKKFFNGRLFSTDAVGIVIREVSVGLKNKLAFCLFLLRCPSGIVLFTDRQNRISIVRKN